MKSVGAKIGAANGEHPMKREVYAPKIGLEAAPMLICIRDSKSPGATRPGSIPGSGTTGNYATFPVANRRIVGATIGAKTHSAMPLALLLLLSLSAAAQPIERNRAEVRAFRAANPCPSTGMTRGPCAGWQIDHRTPIKCGGADKRWQMQWLTVEAHKEKTRQENRWCRRGNPPPAGATVPGMP